MAAPVLGDGHHGDGSSYTELARRAGITLEPSAPFDGYRRDLEHELGLYWPAVPAELEPRPRPTLPRVP